MELVKGQKRSTTRKFFPGYMFVQMDLDQETFHLVKNTPKITGFLGGTNPQPVKETEIQNINVAMTEGATRPKPRISFEEGETVRVIDGPFANFTGDGRRGEGGETEDSRQRIDLWPRNAGRARFRAGREIVEQPPMKKITGFIKLQVPAGKANPSPPIGPALGQHGVNIMEFCKQFNARTQAQTKDDVTIPVEITVFSDRSFTFITKTPPAPILIKKAAGLATSKKPGSGSKEPNKVKVGKITQKQLRDIATTKMPDLNTTDLDAAMRTIAGTARSMGIEVEGQGN